MRKKIAIDIDDVLADSTDAFRISVNEMTGKNLQPEDYLVEGEYWEYYERVWESHGIKLDHDVHEFADTQMRIDQSHIGLVAGAEFAISELTDKYDVVFVTSRTEEWEGATRKWLQKHFGNKHIDVHFVNYKKRHTIKNKGQICKELGADWLIDDNPEHCAYAKENGVEPILFGNYGWHFNLPEDLVRCEDWPAVLEYLSNGAK